MDTTNTGNRLIKSAKLADILLLIVGCFITAFAAECILTPNNLTTSGITGFALALEKIFGISYIYIYYACTFLIILLTLLILGKKEVGKILLLSILYPTTLKGLQLLDIEIYLGDSLLSSIFFGVIFGIGVGLCIKKGFSFGGTDTIGKILHIKVFPHLKLGVLISILDASILIMALFAFGMKTALYAVISQFIFCKVVDYITIGFGMTLYKHEIISTEYKQISDFILTHLGRGVTKKKVVGAYTGEEKVQISCVCSPKESIDIKIFILSVDTTAYIEVIPITSVWGIGRRFNPLK